MRKEWLFLACALVATTLFVTSYQSFTNKSDILVSEEASVLSLSAWDTSFPFLTYTGACNPACLTCSGASANNCLSCPASFYLNDASQCVKTCAVNTYTDSQGVKRCMNVCPTSTFANYKKACSACQTSCLTCNGDLRNNCLSCNHTGPFPYMTYDNRCLSTCLTNTFNYSANGVMQCRLVCNAGLYNSGNDTLCHQCDKTCASCTDTGPTNCLTCNQTGTNSFIYNNMCLQTCPVGAYKFNNPAGYKECRGSCGDGFYYDSEANYCHACMSSCATCNDQNTCLTCNSTNFYVQAQCLTTCPAGSFKFWNAVTQRKECKATCGDGFCYDPLTEFCDACDPTCLACGAPGANNCLTCNLAGPNPIFFDGGCVNECPNGRFVHDNPQGFMECIDSCGDGFMIKNETNHCLDCDSSCQNCNGITASDCLSCYQTGSAPIFFNGKCLATCPSPLLQIVLNGISTCISTCGVGFAVDATNTFCAPCDSTCITCSGPGASSCLTCDQTGATPYFCQGNCLADCPTGLFRVDANVKVCNATCADGFAIDPVSKNCVPCDPSCLTCNTPTSCTKCPVTGTSISYLSGTQCLPECPAGTYRYQDPKGFWECVQTCGQNFYADATTNTCVACDSTCQTCDQAGCLSCGQMSPTSFLYKQKCLSSCTAPTYNFYNSGVKMCTDTCSTGYFIDTASNYCFPCEATCQTCSSSSTCTTCDQSGSTPFLYNNQCLSDCNPGTYRYNNPGGYKECIASCGTTFLYDTTSGYCLPCDGSCLECTSTASTGCLSCDMKGATPFFLNSQCLSDCAAGTFKFTTPVGVQECIGVCGAGFFVDSTSNYCLPCDGTCQTCTGPNNNNCVNCDQAGQTPYSYNNECLRDCGNSTYRFDNPPGFLQCIPVCGSSFFINAATNYCSPCHASCSICDGPGSSDCVACDLSGSSPYFLNDQCLSDCPIGTHKFIGNDGSKTCRSTCGVGYFYDSANNFCMPCDSSCVTCDGSTTSNCLTCPASHFWTGGMCVVACPNGTYKFKNTYTGRKECILYCDSGKVADANDECQYCDPTCQECSAVGHTKCLSCNQLGQTPFFWKGQCLSQCPAGLFNFDNEDGSKTCKSACGDGFVYDPATHYCVMCGPGCQSCTASSLTKCQSCYYDGPAPFLVSGKCQSNCPLNFYQFDDTTQRLKTCIDTCEGSFYVNVTTNYCEPCDVSCETCKGHNPTDCLTCASLSETCFYVDGMCVRDCPSGQYKFFNKKSNRKECETICGPGFAYQKDDNSCDPCDVTCLTCSDMSSSSCTTCNTTGPNPYRSAGQCLAECTPGNYRFDDSDGSKSCISNCGDGFAVKPGTNYCQPCDSSCATCEIPKSRTSCNTCGSTLPFFDNGQCLVKCPEDLYGYTFGVESRCVPNCPDGTYSYENAAAGKKICTDLCVGGTYANKTTQSCAPCHSSCEACIAGSASSCIACPPANPFITPGHRCVAECPVRLYTYQENGVNSCVKSCPKYWYLTDAGVYLCTEQCPEDYALAGKLCYSQSQGIAAVVIILVILLVLGLILLILYCLWKCYKKRDVDDPLQEPLRQSTD